jgi:hypothetical protein
MIVPFTCISRHFTLVHKVSKNTFLWHVQRKERFDPPNYLFSRYLKKIFLHKPHKYPIHEIFLINYLGKDINTYNIKYMVLELS